MDILTTLGTVAGLGMMAGLRLYATVLVAGLAVRMHWIRLPDSLSQLSVLGDTWVLVVAGSACLLELLADKIPYVDTFWDTVHTVVRPLGAALIGLAAAGSLSLSWHVILFLLAGGVALTSHTAKAGTRAVINASPEPLSNIAVSTIEDIFTVLGSWLVMSHPIIALGLVVAFLVVFVVVVRTLYRYTRQRIRRGLEWISA